MSDRDTERCDVCENDVHRSGIVNRGLDREEYDQICANCSHIILSLCDLGLVKLDRLSDRSTEITVEYRTAVQNTENNEIDRIETALSEIIATLDASSMPADKRISVEYHCQKIHRHFGGTDLEQIYPDVKGSDRDE